MIHEDGWEYFQYKQRKANHNKFTIEVNICHIFGITYNIVKL